MGFKIKTLFRRTMEIIFQDEYVLQKSSKISQILLSLKYKELRSLHIPLPEFEDVEFRAFSQNGEDGILLYIFSLIGTTNKRCIEMCAADGLQCNTANLIINHGWDGLLFDGRGELVRRGQKFYASCADTFTWPPKLVHAWITAENVNLLIRENGFAGDIDLLSLDMDGIDYWIWKVIDCVNPRVIVLEYNNALGPDVSATIPNKADFRVEIEDGHMNYFGASLSAFVKLGKQKGYRLVGCERYGFNAFFVRDGVSEDVLPEISALDCFDHPYTKHAMEVRRLKIAKKEWIEV
jgi:hypothetical protein